MISATIEFIELIKVLIIHLMNSNNEQAPTDNRRKINEVEFVHLKSFCLQIYLLISTKLYLVI